MKEEVLKDCQIVRTLIKKGQVRPALLNLQKVVKTNPILDNKVTLWLARYNKSKSRTFRGIIRSESHRVLENELIEAMLETISRLEQYGKISSGKLITSEPLFGEETSSYRNHFHRSINFVRIFGMQEAVALKGLYVRVNVLEKITTYWKVTPEELQRQFDENKREFNDSRPTIDAEEVTKHLQRFIVLGKPGAGKTTFLKYLALLHLEEEKVLSKRRLPIFISLKELAERGISIEDFAIEQLKQCRLYDTNQFLTSHQETGSVIWLLDGLDEVPEKDSEKIIGNIVKYSDEFPKSQYVITCRIAAYNHQFHRFVDIEIADFGDDQISQFIFNWFKHEPEIGLQCWTQLDSIPQLKELARSPLLLTLLCVAYDEVYSFPQNRSELYREATEALLRKWDTSRRIKRDEIYKNLTFRRREILIERVAKETFENGNYFFPIATVSRIVKQFIENFPETREEFLDLDSNAIVRAVEAQHGIWMKRAKREIYSFSHLTLEYV